MDDFVKAAKEADADGILAASVFHFGEIKIKDLKEYMKSKDMLLCVKLHPKSKLYKEFNKLSGENIQIIDVRI